MPRPNMSEEDLKAMKYRMGGGKEHGRKLVSPTTGTKHPVAAQTGHAPQTFFVPGKMPGQNDFMGHGKHWTYGKAKKEWAKKIAAALAEHRILAMTRVHIEWVWVERNTRRDPDNFTGISKKFILDTLVAQGILDDDGWKQIAGWSDRWHVDADCPGVHITLTEVA